MDIETEPVAKENQKTSKEEKIESVVLKKEQTEKEIESVVVKKEQTEKEIVSVVKEDQTESVKIEDPFAYLDRNDFTSEKYKIEVRNLPKHYGISVCIIFEIY